MLTFLKNIPTWEIFLISVIFICVVMFVYTVVKTSRERKTGIEGYVYDSLQDIFYAPKDAWQRDFGYCRFYDEMLVPMNIVADCEPIQFEYGGKSWLIEFWKGQYGMMYGAEIGVYNTYEDQISEKTIYKCVPDEEMLLMTFILYKNGVPVFSRNQKHWWLTGFKAGEFSQPEELTMSVLIRFLSEEMCSKFVRALSEAGYKHIYVDIEAQTAAFNFINPKNNQPEYRYSPQAKAVQSRNEIFCYEFKKITGKIPGGSSSKLKIYKRKAKKSYKSAVCLGKPIGIFDYFSGEEIFREC